MQNARALASRALNQLGLSMESICEAKQNETHWRHNENLNVVITLARSKKLSW